ncbi:DUF7537 family lipoprotein [Haloarchaeobius sp. DYHT-AS-18]|uniref:DUF7537 family lipoprotein n=1 Tax=Haloarchaeobius sp. DYHT-AS-18 TaxID=3446117 RepID=UPI003EC0BE44
MSSLTRRTLWLLVVVVLVASAGCLGGTAPDDTATDPTVTDSATPATTDSATDESSGETLTATTGTQTATGSSGTQAHPLSSKRLATSHATSLQDAENFTLDYSIDMTQVTSTETQSFTFDWTVQADLATGAQAIDGTLAGDGFTTSDDNSTMQFDLYVSPDGTATQRSAFGDTVQYQQADAAQYDVSTYLTAMNATSALDPEAANFTYDGPTTVDGETLYVYTVSDLDQLYLPTDQADASAFDYSSVSKFDLRLVVDDAGTLREMQYDLEVTEDGSKLNLHFELSYTELGTTTVEEPDWLDEAST